MNVADLVKGTFGKTHEGALLAWETRARGGQPEDISTWKRVGPQQGSNPGGEFEAPDGTRYYVKFPQTSPEQVRSEQLANSIYHTLDIPVPETHLVTGNVGWGEAGNLGIASKMLDAKPMTREEIAKSEDVREGFLADAYLANHDVMGAGYDNILHGEDGRDYRVDNGGAMYYRAQGATKDFDADTVSQIDTMRNPETAREAGHIFASINDDELHSQAMRIVMWLSDSKIRNLVGAAGITMKRAEYVATLIGRRNAIADRFKIRRPTEFKVQKTHEGALRAWETRQRAKPKAPKADASEQERRRAAAFKNFKPQTEEKELIAHESEQRVAAALGGEATTDAHPMDIWWPSTANPQVGIEVKTLIEKDLTNVRVNMRPDCKEEKIEALGNKRGIVVLLDQRGRKSLGDKSFTEKVYWREGMGAWRLHTMNEAGSISELKHALGLR